MSIEKRAQALIDLDDLAAYLTVHAGPDIAYRFLDAAEKTLERIAAMPASGALFECDDPRLAGIRHTPISGFPSHYLFYFERADRIGDAEHPGRDDHPRHQNAAGQNKEERRI